MQEESHVNSEEEGIVEEKGNTRDSSATTASSSAPRKGRKSKSKSTKVDMKAKLERSRQSARECRARKKLRYQYLEDLVQKREKAVLLLKKELEVNRELLNQIDQGNAPSETYRILEAKSDRK
ncbi:cAMP-responsive element-binding protein-like 2 [Halotydeus destructor]|nr:cAMP-responsive element-binding protein-like 2 [Halotydeus destructor]